MLTKENAPLLSVIVPVYNTEEFLPECLESIINQTYTNLEIIVVNDGSPGNCDEIVAEFAKKDKRIKYVIPSHNEGLLTARFRGFEQATGEYIAFVDSDDSIGIDYYRLFIKKALEEDADIVTGCYTSVYENGIKKTHNMAYNYINFINYKGTDVFDNFVNSEGYLTYYINLCYKIYKKDVLEKSYPCLS
ncbi:MAG: glycosyltransferase, partial [Oscillospiraceae bacterium]|nr:glycosyltransferase [Oscillospiraceae bacterium]